MTVHQKMSDLNYIIAGICKSLYGSLVMETYKQVRHINMLKP